MFLLSLCLFVCLPVVCLFVQVCAQYNYTIGEVQLAYRTCKGLNKPVLRYLDMDWANMTRYAYTCAHTHTHVHARTHTRAHAHAHAHAHTHTHVCNQVKKDSFRAS